MPVKAQPRQSPNWSAQSARLKCLADRALRRFEIRLPGSNSFETVDSSTC
jgi:hypothetical protein